MAEFHASTLLLPVCADCNGVLRRGRRLGIFQSKEHCRVHCQFLISRLLNDIFMASDDAASGLAIDDSIIRSFHPQCRHPLNGKRYISVAP